MLCLQDYNSNWCMAIEMINDDTYLASEVWWVLVHVCGMQSSP